MSIESPRGIYRQIADQLRAAIENGEYPRGTALPSEPDLVERYRVSRPTINRAISILRQEGLVRVERGRGTFVNAVPPIARISARYDRANREREGARGAFDSEIRNLGLIPRSDLHIKRVQPPERVARILGVNPEQVSTLVRARLMYAGDTPVQIADSYIPLDIAADTALEAHDSGPGGMISRLAELGHAQTRISETITVRSPTPDEAAFLTIEEDQRIYEITHTGWTATGRACEVCIHVMPTHQWELTYSWPTN